MKTIVVIQARMGSSRLPGKVLLSLGETCVLDYVVTRCKRIFGVSEVIVATSTLFDDNKIAEWCKANHVQCYRGSEEDVLSRYYECALLYRPDYIIRVTSDCPFVDYQLAGEVVESMKSNAADIAILQGNLPRGLAVEMVSFTALEKIYKVGNEPRHREHVTYYAYEYPEQFSRLFVQVPDYLQYPQLRITLDTAEDYTLCMKVADAFPGQKDFVSGDVVLYLLDHPDIALLNANIEQKPVV
jgi:spore coat polysaccharide biosynthesis protein SpsF